MMDQFYYESGYIDESYFVYIADAEAAVVSTTQVSCLAEVIAGGQVIEGTSSWMSQTQVVVQASLILGGQASLESTFTQTAALSHIYGADLFAMSNADLAVQVSCIRDNNIDVTSAFSQVVTGAKFIYVGSDQNAEFNISADNQRVRFNEAAIDAAFSLSADTTRIIAGVTVEAYGAWTSSTSLSATISHIHGADLNAFNSATVLVQANIIRNNAANLESVSIQTALVNKNVIIVSNLESTTSISCTATKVIKYTANLVTNSTLTSVLTEYFLQAQWLTTESNGYPFTFSSTQRAGISGTGVSLTQFNRSESLYLQGTTAVDTAILAPGTKDFTLEFFLHTGRTGTSQVLFQGFGITVSAGRPNGFDRLSFSLTTSVQTYTYGTLIFNNPNTDTMVNGMVGLVFVRSANTFSIYARDYYFSSTLRRLYTGTISGSVISSTNAVVFARSEISSDPIAFDEFRVSIGQARYIGLTPAVDSTIPLNKGTSTLLTHFDNSYANDQGIADAAAAIIARNTLAVSSTIVKQAQASLQSNGFLVSAAGRIRPFVDIEVATFSLDGSVNAIKGAGVVLSSSSSLNSLITKNIGTIEINASSTAQLTADYGILKAGSVQLSSSSNLDAYLGLIKGTAANTNANFVLEIQALAVKVTGASLNVTTSVNLTNDKLVSGTASLSSQTNLQAIAGNTIPFISTPSSSFSLDCSTKRIAGLATNLVQASQLVATVRVSKTAQVNLASQAVQSVQITRTRAVIISTESVATELVATSRLLKSGASLFSLTALVANVSVISTRTNAVLVSNLELVVSLTRLAGLSSQQTASSQLQAQLGKVVNAQAGLTMQAFTLAVLNKVVFDLELTWIIPSENTNWTIPVENNYYLVEYEDRTYKIKGK